MKKDPKTKVDELKEMLAGKKKPETGSRGPETGNRRPEAGSRRTEEIDDLAKQLRVTEEEARGHYDKLLRVMAELDNFKKRMEREKQELVRYGNEQLVSDLLPVLDDMDRVLEHVPEGASKELVDFVNGVQMVAKQFLATLCKYGLKEIDSEGKEFNPEFHEAVMHVPHSEVKPDHVVEVHRKGYMLNDRVIRAPMVSVSKGK